MVDTVNVTPPVGAEVAEHLDTPARREAVVRYLSRLLKGERVRAVLVEAIADTKREARASGLTEREARASGLTGEEIDAELEAWRLERQA